MEPIRLVLADDHVFVRQGTRYLLEAEPDFVVVGEAGDGEEAVRLTQELQPDILLLDLSMPRLHGVEVARQVRDILPAVGIVVLTGAANPSYTRALLDLDVEGYLDKTLSQQELCSALRRVYAGQRMRDPILLRSLQTQGARTVPTPRQLEVIKLVDQGLTDKEIAAAMKMKTNTVRDHLKRLFTKFDVNSRTELVSVARRQGWLD